MSPPKFTGASHLKYRPDIDGLRAIAVLSVVIYHAFPKWMPGGFTGVDIFFVISGYLISSLIFKSLESDTFSFTEFYIRRIRRIFPALLTVLAITLIVGWFTLLADEYQQLGKHVAASAAFISNFIFWRESGYFDTSSETKPLLHLWSLGIEEQFYILWPPILWVSKKLKANLFVITLILAIISIYLNLKVAGKSSVAAFYAPYTRFWELMSGSLLAWLTLHPPASRGSSMDRQMTANLLSLLGFIICLVGFFGIRKLFLFSEIWALVPVLGALLIMGAGPTSLFNRKILASKIAVGIGLISYPLYLWHWPLLSFTNILKGEFSVTLVRTCAVLLSFILAWLTYALIEKKIRASFNIKIIALALISMIFMGVVGLEIYTMGGWAFRKVVHLNVYNVSPTYRDRKEVLKSYEPICGIEDETTRKTFEFCVQDKRGNVKYALIGDSKASSLYDGLVRTSSENARWMIIGGYNALYGAVLPILHADPKLRDPLSAKAIDAVAQNPKIETVAIVAAIRSLFNLDQALQNWNGTNTYNYKYLELLSQSARYPLVLDDFNRTIDILVGAGKKVVLVVDNPPLPSAKACIPRQTSINFINRFLWQNNEKCYLPRATFENLISSYRKLLGELKARHPESVEIFDPTEIYCDEQTCGPFLDNKVMYGLTDHISDYAAGVVGGQLNQYLNQETR